MPRRFREIRAAEKRFLVGREKQREWPSAGALRQHVVSGLVDLIKIRPLLTIDFDIDEVAVHRCRNLSIFEAFMGHDMAPVTGRVAYGKQYGLVMYTGKRQRFFPPGIPVHRVIHVLK